MATSDECAVVSTTTLPISDFGFDPDAGIIRLEVLATTSGRLAFSGQSVLDGHQIFWDRLNAEGGVGGKYQVELVVRDNAFNPEQNIAVYNEIKDQVLAFSSMLGTPSTATIFEDADQQDILVMAGSQASQWSMARNVVLNLATNTFFAQFANAPFWAMEIADPPVITAATRVGIIHQADDYGQDCKDGYDFAHANLGFRAVYTAIHAPFDTEFSAQVGGARAAGVDILFVCSTPTALGPIIGTAAAIQYFPTILGSSASYVDGLAAALGGGDPAAGVGLFNVFPYYNLGTTTPWEASVPGIVTMR